MAKTNDQVAAAPRPAFVMKMTNTVLSLLLRSPLHKRVSETLLLLAFRGRKSGKHYSFPVGYIRENKDDLLVLTPVRRSWWKNFRDGALVTIYVQGQKRQGTAQVVYDDPKAIAQGITAFLRNNPKATAMYHIELNASGEPTPASLTRVIPHWMAVRIHLIS